MLSPSSRIVLTHHAIERLRERQLSENWVEQTVLSPLAQHRGKNRGTREFIRRFGPSQVTVVAYQNKRQEWVVVSAWVDPPVPGTKDYFRRQRYLRYQAAPWWQKFAMLALKQLGIWNF